MHRRRAPIALLTLLALVATACSDDGAPEVETVEVAAGEVVQTVAAPARIEPRARRSVTATVPGVVAQVLVDDGDVVAAGDPVVLLESDQVELGIAQAGAAVEAAGALTGVSPAPDLSPVVASVRQQLEGTVGPLIASLSAQARQVQDAAARERALTAVAQLVSAYEDTRTELLRAERQARASTARASAAQRQAAAAQQDRAESALEAAEERRDALTLVAPIDGVVELGGAGAPALDAGDGLSGLLDGRAAGAGPVAPGVAVAPGQTLFTVYDLGGFHAVATVDEIDVVLVREGQRATVLVDAYPDLEIDAVVDAVAIAPERTSAGGVVYAVRVSLTGLPDDVSLRVGLTASAEIVVARVDGEQVVPTSALRRRDGREVVLVVRDGVAHVVPVEVVAIGTDTAAVEGDVREGEQVVVVGADDLDDGDVVP